MPRAGFEPAIPMFERPKTVLATETGKQYQKPVRNYFCTLKITNIAEYVPVEIIHRKLCSYELEVASSLITFKNA
jgi:hypothetical protein